MSEAGGPRRWRSGNLGRPVTVTSGDLDGDGHNEILAAAGKDLKIYDWRLGTYVMVFSLTLNQEILSLAHGDLDGDGVNEVAVGTKDQVLVLESEPGGARVAWTTLLYPNAFFRQLSIGDSDGDGKAELVAAASGAQTLYFFKVLDQDGREEMLEVGRIYLGGLLGAEVAPGGGEVVAATKEGYVDVFVPGALLPTKPVQTHVVQQGEALWRIARRYRTTVEAILKANGLSKPQDIKAGQLLLIPSGR